MSAERGDSRTLQGVVSSAKMDKTVRVKVVRTIKHPTYKKYVKRYAQYLAHDEGNTAQEGDLVLIAESRPYSKNKRWRLRQVVTKAVA